MSYVITTNWDGYWRMRRLADRCVPPCCPEAGDEMPFAQDRLEAHVRAELTALVDADFAARYLAEPLPRPPMEVRVLDFSQAKEIKNTYGFVKEST